MAFIFGGNTGETAESIAQKRAIAEALMAQRLGSPPQNLGEGLNAIGNALAIRRLSKRADKGETKLKGEAAASAKEAIARALMGSGGGSAPSPQPMPAQPGMAAPAPAQAPGVPRLNVDVPPQYQEAVSPEFAKHVPGIFAGESGGDYDALFGFSNRDGGKFSNVKLTDMTVDEALAFANPSGEYGQWVAGQNDGTVATPMGAYQVVGTTLSAAKKGLGLKGNEPMTRETQDRIGEWIFQNQGLGAWKGYKPGVSAPQQPPVQMAQAGGTMTDAQPNYGMIEALSAVLSNPYTPPGQRAVAEALIGRTLESTAPMSPYERAQLGQGDRKIGLDEQRFGFEQQKFGQEFGLQQRGQAFDEYQFGNLSEQQRQQIALEQARLDEQRRQHDVPAAQPPTGDIQEYEYARQNGYEGSFADFQREMAQAGSNTNIGSIPQGYQATRAPDGSMRMEPIPGGPAEQEMAAAAEAREDAAASRDRYGNVVIDDIGRIRERVAASPMFTTGLGGSLLKDIPGTGAYDVKSLTETIRASVGFDRLQEMREQSPTGGALGAVSDTENRLLAATLGNLEQSQSDEQFLYNLDRLENVYLDIIHGPGNRPEMGGGGTPSGVDPDLWQHMTPEERALWQ